MLVQLVYITTAKCIVMLTESMSITIVTHNTRNEGKISELDGTRKQPTIYYNICIASFLYVFITVTSRKRKQKKMISSTFMLILFFNTIQWFLSIFRWCCCCCCVSLNSTFLCVCDYILYFILLLFAQYLGFPFYHIQLCSWAETFSHLLSQ